MREWSHRSARRQDRVALATAAVLMMLALALCVGEAVANARLILTTWRIEPSTVKENQPWTVKLWVGNMGDAPPKKGFTVQVLGCDKEYKTCDKVYANHDVKLATGDLAPGQMPGKEIIMEIKQGLGKGEHYILFVVDPKKEVNDAPLQKQVRVPVGFYKF
jgi:hypothetical protein